MTEARATTTEQGSRWSTGGVLSGKELNAQPLGEQPLVRLNLRRALRMRSRWIWGFLAVGLLITAVLVLRHKPNYSATAMVYVPPSPQPILPNGIPRWPYDSPTYEMHIQEQINSFSRSDVLAGALKRLQGTGWLQSKENEQAAETRLQHAFTATRDGNSYQIAVKAQSSSADMAARLANAVAESYLENQRIQEDFGATTRIHLLQEEQKRVQTLMASDRQELEGVNRQLGVGAITATMPDPYDQEVATLRAELAKARSEHDLATAQLLSAQSGAYIGDTENQAQSDPGLISLKTGLYERRSALIAQMAGLTLQHPLYKQDTVELQQLDKAIDEVTHKLEAAAQERIQKKLQGQVKTTEDEVEKLSSELSRATTAAGDSTQYMQQAGGLNAEIERLQKRYGLLDEQIHDQILEHEAPNGIHIASEAIVPQKPDASKVLLLSPVVVIFFGFLGLAAAVVRNRMDPLIYVAQDVEQEIGARPLVVIPDADEVSSRFVEQAALRAVAALQSVRRGEKARRGLMTALAQETLLEEVAAVIRRGQRSVDPGWEWMRTTDGETELASVLPISFEQAAARFTAEAGGERCLMIECEPFLRSGETEYLTRFSDVVLVVIESGVTRRSDLRTVSEALQRMPVRRVGFVLAGMKLAQADASEEKRIRELDDAARRQTRQEERQSRLIGSRGTSRQSEPAMDLDTDKNL